jgi:hypothetical protein
MRLVRRRIWTPRRQWLGNLIPASMSIPLVAAGSALILLTPSTGVGFVLATGGIVVGWAAINRFGLFENSKMRDEVEGLLRGARPRESAERVFVGLARPTFRSAVDPHEDVGFLLVHADRVEFFGESLRLVLARGQVHRVRFRPNVHSLLGLGRWVSIEGSVDGRPVRMLVEPRERETLLGNRRFGEELRLRLERLLLRTPEGP